MSVSVNQSTRKSIQTTKTFNSNLTTQSTPEITLNITNEEIKKESKTNSIFENLDLRTEQQKIYDEEDRRKQIGEQALEDYIEINYLKEQIKILKNDLRNTLKEKKELKKENNKLKEKKELGKHEDIVDELKNEVEELSQKSDYFEFEDTS